jgi:hypothetical protein
VLEGDAADSAKALANLQKRQEAIKRIGENLEGLKGVNLEKVLDSTRFNLIGRQLQAGITSPLTGGLDSLANIADQQYQQIIAKLAQTSDATPIEIKIAFKDQTGRDFDPIAGPQQFAQNMAAAAAQIRKELAAIEDLPGLDRDIDIANTAINARRQAAEENIPEGRDQTGQNLRAGLDKFGSLISTFQQQVGLGTAEGLAAATNTLKEIIVVQSQLQARVASRPATDQSVAAVAEKTLANLATEVVRNAQTIVESEAKAIPLRAIATSGDELKTQLDSTAASLTTVNARLEGFSGALQAGFEASQVPRNAKGGPIGPDTMLSRLTPGEFVMNPRASQAFRPLLRSLNSAALPRFAKGGDTINVGDVNLNISTTRPEKINARTLAQQFQREIRKGTLK